VASQAIEGDDEMPYRLDKLDTIFRTALVIKF
jgi:hypothetical protein